MFVLFVQTGRGLVKNQNGRRAKRRPRDGDALSLPVGECGTPFAEDGFVTLGQRHDEIMRVGRARGLADLVKARAGSAAGDVVAHRDGEEDVVLQHDADLRTQRLEREPANVLSVDQHPPLLGVVETQNESDQR